MRRIVFSSDKFSVVMKDCDKEEIEAALQYAVDSERFICHRITNLLLSKKVMAEKQDSILTSTEQEILKLIALGRTTKEIASERFSSTHTIITHRKNIFRKLAVNNVHEATKYALRAGIVDSAEYYI
jgi:DNA-binding NarL/FixJ family response regulator